MFFFKVTQPALLMRISSLDSLSSTSAANFRTDDKEAKFSSLTKTFLFPDSLIISSEMDKIDSKQTCQKLIVMEKMFHLLPNLLC